MLEEKNAIFIVNASNTRLLLGSGVSMAFKHWCGLKLQKEMIKKVKTITKLEKGDVVITSSCDADNFNYILHAVVMDYNRGVRGNDKLPKLADINSILQNIQDYIILYSKKNTNLEIKLVLPLLGCGVGGLNKTKVIQIYKNFFEKNIEITCNLVIYGYSYGDFLLLKNSFN